MRKLTVVGTVGEVQHLELVVLRSFQFGDVGHAGGRPAVVQTVSKDNPGGFREILKAPLLVHSVRFHDDARKPCLAVLFVPLVRKMAWQKHAFLGVSGANDQILAALEFPDFANVATAASGIVRSSDSRVGSVGEFLGQIETFGRSVVVAATVSSVCNGAAEFEELVYFVHGGRGIIGLLKDDTGLGQGRVRTRWVVIHVEIGKYGRNQILNGFADEFLDTGNVRWEGSGTKSGRLCGLENVAVAVVGVVVSVIGVELVADGKDGRSNRIGTPRRGKLGHIGNLFVISVAIDLLGIQFEGCRAGVGNINQVGVSEAHHGRQKSGVGSSKGNNGAVPGVGRIGTAAQPVADVLNQLYGVLQGLVRRQIFHHLVHVGSATRHRLGFSIKSVLRTQHVCMKGGCQSVGDKGIDQRFQIGFPAHDHQNRMPGASKVR
mmetsp:Transcript_20839/g.45367  ORF Transcript_20839/g.45367 Transcript_20839/m.45367 type:complete len:433 (+) Transcript_20839:245-1543(+)